MDIAALFERLGTSQTLPYTHDAYMSLSKAKQDETKDVGAYIAGALKDGRRKAGSCISRCAAVLDADNLPTGSTEDFIRRVASVGVCCCIHSTAKHSPASPRLRVVVPFSEDIPAEQYAPTVRLLCQLIQPEMSWFDPSTDQAGRIMYWAAHCQDVAPVHYAQDGNGLLDVKGLLTSASFNWKDIAAWPQFPREQAPVKLGAKQADPETKEGLVGAFCRCYDIPAAMEKFLPGVYEKTAIEGRYTFTGGSTWGGAVVYDGEKFLFSNHATDPAGGILVNSFDLVRLHIFRDLDDAAKEGTPTAKLPSYSAMLKLAREDSEVSALRAHEVFSQAMDAPAADEDAAVALGRCEGCPISKGVVDLALKALGISARMNEVTKRAEISGMPPEYSTENAINTLPVLLVDKLRAIGVKGVSRAVVADYLSNVFDTSRFNPVLDFLDGAAWDGADRLPELLHIIGVAPGSLGSTLVRKWLVQCVAMAHNTPNRQVAADGVLTLQGPQRIGKTHFFRRLSMRSSWFVEGASVDLRNKDTVLNATGGWITELGELDSTLRRDQSGLKAFVTQPVDRIRAPYARETTVAPRRTSFCATVNPGQFLRDDTGDLRFWIIAVEHIDLQALLSITDAWMAQLWAQAVSLWKMNPDGFRLDNSEKKGLTQANSQFREVLPGEEEIRQALNYDLPQSQWGEFSSCELKGQLFGRLDHLTSSQVGRALSKIEGEDSSITARVLKGVRLHRLPITKTLQVLSSGQICPTPAEMHPAP